MSNPLVPSQTVGAAAPSTLPQGFPVQSVGQGTSLPNNTIQGTSPVASDLQEGGNVQNALPVVETADLKPAQNDGAAAS